MKEIKILAALLIAFVAMSSCSSEDLPVMVPVDADGEWYAEVAMTGTTYDMRSEGELIEVNYDHIGVKLSLKEGIGEWTHYYIKDGEMVNYEGGYDNLFEYTTAGDGTIQVNSFDELDDLSFVKSLNMRYSDSRILAKVNGLDVVFSSPTAEETLMLKRWDAIITEDHMGYAGDEIETDLDPNNADEPSRARTF
jgi:hypothetical protein